MSASLILRSEQAFREESKMANLTLGIEDELMQICTCASHIVAGLIGLEGTLVSIKRIRGIRLRRM